MWFLGAQAAPGVSMRDAVHLGFTSGRRELDARPEVPSMFSIHRNRNALPVVVIACLLVSGTARADFDAAGRAKGSRNGVYLVRMLEDPVVAYGGGIPG